MKKLFPLVMGLMVTLQAYSGTAISLRDAVSGTYSPQMMRGLKPLADGESYAQVSDDGKSIVRYSFKTGAQVGVVFDAEKARGPKVRSIEGYIMSPDESRILIQTETESIYRRSKKATYYIYSVQNNKLEPLSEGGKQQEPLFSPDGNQIAFVRDNNLYLVKLLFNNAESQVTADGKFNEVINGVPDWVNEEEFAVSRSFDFSADSKMLAWVKYDEKDVPLYRMPMFRGMNPELKEYASYPGFYDYKYPKAGEQNAVVGVYSYDIKSHVTRKLNLPLAADGYVPRIKFTSVPDQLAVLTLNRLQNEMNVYMCNTRSLVCKLAVSEKEDRYVKEDAYEQFHLYDNNFLLVSDRGGNRQLYWYTLSGQLVKQITSGSEVTKYYGYDAKTGTFFYQAKDETPLRTAVFRTDLKGKTRKITAEQGMNDATFATGMKYFVHVYSNLNTPPVVSICTAEGKTEKVLINNAALKQKLAGVDMARKEFFSFKTSEGVELNGWMMKPVNFDASHKYPVIMYQYSGPGSQCVQDSWNTGFMPGGVYESYLCSQGFIVACVDGRGTGGRGADFEKCTYQRLGLYEARDQVEAALYLGNQSYVDAANIGIWGWSYGGFNTLMSMSEGRPVFKAGVAVAPPTNYRYYDTIYTERYMRTPAENPDGYDDNALTRAAKLNGRLLICHGLADDNVHAQNTIEYTEALVQADKQFEMQLYTNRNHSIYGGNTRYHLFTRMSEFFKQQLQ
ncbi:MAG: S9 family peptidase [Bacteroidaceae bacterium]|nr:S9 family peptidase [Bacteroidaceae bacterium]